MGADTRRVVRHALQRESKDLNARTHTRFVRRKPLSSNGGQGERDERPARRADDDASEERLDGRSSDEPDELLLPESAEHGALHHRMLLLVGCVLRRQREGGRFASDVGQVHVGAHDPGIYCINPCGTSLKKITLKQQATELPNVKLLDLRGNPVVVSGVVFWQVHSIKAAVLNVESVYQYVQTSASAVLKQVVSKYPYEDDDNGGHSLKTEAAAVSQEMTNVLQDRLAHTGVRVIAFNLADLSYAPEIAQAMLVRQ